MKALVICILISVFLLSRGEAKSAGKSLALCDLADLTGWEGLVPDQTVSYHGMPAPKWDHGKSPQVHTDRIPQKNIFKSNGDQLTALGNISRIEIDVGKRRTVASFVHERAY